MILSCECLLHGLLPLDVEPAVLDRSGGLCEFCQDSPATTICTIGSLREFATPNHALHLCVTCHEIKHITVIAAARQMIREEGRIE